MNRESAEMCLDWLSLVDFVSSSANPDNLRIFLCLLCWWHLWPRPLQLVASAMAAMAEVQKYKMQVERFELFREDIEDLVKLTVDKMDLWMHLDKLELACTHTSNTYAHIDVISHIVSKSTLSGANLSVTPEVAGSVYWACIVFLHTGAFLGWGPLSRMVSPGVVS